ncbi:uncharacterized protein TNCV_4794091 [Trichonephila clavipes]|nr:uncharacterized protein TNCV_4794091 [Trichonephila clavipes]
MVTQNVPVAIDGTWQKRGHTSLNGVVTAVSVDTGKVIDAEILSRKCSCHFIGNLHSDESVRQITLEIVREWKLKVHFVSSIAQRTATAASDVVQSGRPIFDDFFQHLWPYIGNNTANVVFQMVKRLWLIRIDQ